MSGNPRTDPVNARIIFRGVMLACINRDNQYEVGMVHCPFHEPTITVEESYGGSVSECRVRWPAGHDLLFKVTNPDHDGVSIDPTSNREIHFDRVIDAEGFLLHRGRVTVNTSLLQGRRLAVTAGTLYTNRLSPVEFDLLTWTDESDPGMRRGHIGTIAQEVGLNILCLNQPGSGIEIMDLETREVIRSMPASNGRTYEVTIENDCRKARKGKIEVGTDFRYFYNQDFITSREGLKFDLGIIKKGQLKQSPDACENTFLSQTDTLGIKS